LDVGVTVAVDVARREAVTDTEAAGDLLRAKLQRRAGTKEDHQRGPEGRAGSELV
jgi:hypothetical protein